LAPQHTFAILTALIAVGALAIAVSGKHARPALTGLAAVIDGDTLSISSARVRLAGIDAPELGQSCEGTAGRWSCGMAATAALIRLVNGRPIICNPRGLDRYGRTLAICFVNGRDINAAMVRQGFARAYLRYSWNYILEEALARIGGIGIWQGASQPPWDYRSGKRVRGN
jgi:endonuclease YncB( thermonuclease family)